MFPLNDNDGKIDRSKVFIILLFNENVVFESSIKLIFSTQVLFLSLDLFLTKYFNKH